MSARTAAAQRARAARLRATSHGPERCQFPGGCTGEAVDAHELLSRARGGSIDPAGGNVALLCRPHHDWVTCHPLDALAMGMSLRRDSVRDFTRDSSTDTLADVTDETPKSEAKRQQIAVRLSSDLLDRIDQRAARYKRSRNEWIELMLARGVDMPRQTSQRQESF